MKIFFKKIKMFYKILLFIWVNFQIIKIIINNKKIGKYFYIQNKLNN